MISTFRFEYFKRRGKIKEGLWLVITHTQRHTHTHTSLFISPNYAHRQGLSLPGIYLTPVHCGIMIYNSISQTNSIQDNAFE